MWTFHFFIITFIITLWVIFTHLRSNSPACLLWLYSSNSEFFQNLYCGPYFLVWDRKKSNMIYMSAPCHSDDNSFKKFIVIVYKFLNSKPANNYGNAVTTFNLLKFITRRINFIQILLLQCSFFCCYLLY